MCRIVVMLGRILGSALQGSCAGRQLSPMQHLNIGGRHAAFACLITEHHWAGSACPMHSQGRRVKAVLCAAAGCVSCMMCTLACVDTANADSAASAYTTPRMQACCIRGWVLLCFSSACK